MDSINDAVALERAAENEERKAERARRCGLPQFAVFHEAQARALREAKTETSPSPIFLRRPYPPCPAEPAEPARPAPALPPGVWLILLVVLAFGFGMSNGFHWLAMRFLQVLP